MALVTTQKTPVAVPHEEGCEFVFRPLSKRELREADEENTRLLLKLQREIREGMSAEDIAAATEAAAQRRADGQLPDPREGLDKDVLLKYGVVSWSGPGYDGVSCDEANKAELDAQTYDWAVGLILDMNMRPPGEGNASVTLSEKASSPAS